jgi:hypothetical protein
MLQADCCAVSAPTNSHQVSRNKYFFVKNVILSFSLNIKCTILSTWSCCVSLYHARNYKQDLQCRWWRAERVLLFHTEQVPRCDLKVPCQPRLIGPDDLKPSHVLAQRGQWPRWNRKWSVEFPNFFLFKVKIWYGDISLWNSFAGYSLLKKLWAQNDDLKFQRGHKNRFGGLWNLNIVDFVGEY